MTVLAAAETLTGIHQPGRAAEILSGLNPAFLTGADRERLALLRVRLAPPAAPADDASPAIAAAVAQEAWRQGLWSVYHAAADDAANPEAPSAFPRRIAAAYLAHGVRLAADAENAFKDQPILAALAAQEKSEASTAQDLRALLAGAGAVLALEPLLFPSAKPLSETEQPDPSPSIEQG